MRRELLPGRPLPFQGAHRPALANFRTSCFLCNFAISDAYYDQAASLHPEQYLFRREMLCVKHSYPAQSALMRQDSAGSTPCVGSVPPGASQQGKAPFQLPGFLRAPAFLHKTRLSLSDFHLFAETWFIFSQLLSFLLIFPSRPQNNNPMYLHSSTPKPDLQTVHPNYCRTAEISPSWWAA